jgi:integrase
MTQPVTVGFPGPRPVSRPSEPRTLVDLRAAVLADASIPEPRRKAMASALNSFARAVGRPLETLPASPQRLRPHLAAMTPAMARLSRGGWQNVKSLLGAALATTVRDFLPGRLDIELSAEWEDLLTESSATLEGRSLIGRFGRFATLRGVEPSQVDDAFLAAYEEALVARSLETRPVHVIRRTAVVWNRLCQTTACGIRPVTLPSRRVRHAVVWDEVPASLRDEVERWIDFLGRDPFAKRDFRALRPATLRTRRASLVLYLGALAESGLAVSDMTSLRAVVSARQAEVALTVIHRRSGERMTSHLAQVLGTVRIIARHWLRLPQPECDELARLARQIRCPQEGLAPRNEQRLAQLNAPGSKDTIFLMTERITRRVIASGAPTVRGAQAFQTAVLIELFMTTALRIGNVAELCIGETFHLRPDGGIDIKIGPEHIKNRTPFAANLPPRTCRMIRRYITTFRPLLGDASGPWLFPGLRDGTHKSTNAIRDQVTRAMAHIGGVAWNPHLFRHFAAHVLLGRDPRADGIVTRALGHRRSDTTRAHYSGWQTQGAIAFLDTVVEEQRQQARRRAARSGER